MSEQLDGQGPLVTPSNAAPSPAVDLAVSVTTPFAGPATPAPAGHAAAVTLPTTTSNNDLDVPHISESRLTLVRDSAVLVGAATTALYLTSQVYGEAYLEWFGVHNGFQAFGLGNLALINFSALLGLVFFLGVIHSMCLDKKLGDLIAGFIWMFSVGSSNLLLRFDHVEQLGFIDFMPLVSAIFISFLIAKVIYSVLPLGQTTSPCARAPPGATPWPPVAVACTGVFPLDGWRHCNLPGPRSGRTGTPCAIANTVILRATLSAVVRSPLSFSDTPDIAIAPKQY